MPSRAYVLSAFLLLIAHVGRIDAGEGCARCGCPQCQKICRLVCEEKKVPVTCWGCKHEEFCVPGPGKPGCRHEEWVCDEQHPEAPCVKPQKFVWTEWLPGGCAKLYTRHKLMRKTIIKTVPSYTWVVEDLCPACESRCEVAVIDPQADIPPAPVVDAKLLTPVPNRPQTPLRSPKR